MTVHGRDNFTVASGVRSPNTATFKDSVKFRVMDLLKKNSAADTGTGTGTGAGGSGSADSAHACANAAKSKSWQLACKGTAKQHSVVGWLGWCMPKTSGADSFVSAHPRIADSTHALHRHITYVYMNRCKRSGYCAQISTQLGFLNARLLQIQMAQKQS